MHYCYHLIIRVTLFSFVIVLGSSCSRQSNKARALAKAAEYYAAGAYDKPEIEYLNTLKADPDNTQAIAQLGLIYTEQGRTRDALLHLQKARDLLPNNLEVRANLASYYLTFKAFNDARTEARYILEHQPTHSDAPLLFAESAQQPKEFSDAKEFLGKLPTAGTAPVLTALASLEFRQNNSPEAEVLLKHALALDPNLVSANAYYGTIFLAQKNMQAAEQSFASCWKNSRPRAAKKLFYVRYKLQNGDIETARSLLTELIAAAPDCLPP